MRQLKQPNHVPAHYNMSKALSTIIVEVDADDRIMQLIESNTHKTTKHKKPASILRLLALVASGTKIAVACRSTGISYQTYVKWIHKPWYKEVMELLKDQMDARLDSSLTGVTHKAIAALEDRVENGDIMTNKLGPMKDEDGELIRKPMSGRDVGVTFATIFDKRQLLRNKPTSVSESVTTDEKLDEIAKRFEDMATIDGDFEVIKDHE